jgi:cobalt-zinc-cadmium efflux system outer membrane protein
MCFESKINSRWRLHGLLSCLSVCCALAFPSSVVAQSTLAPADIDAIIDTIVANNPQLESHRSTVAAQEELIESYGALDDPRISYAIAPNSIGDSIPSSFGNALGVRQNIQLSQSIPWPGKRALRSEKETANTEVAQQRYEGTRLDLITQARALWSQWWFVQDSLRKNLEHQRLALELMEVAETRYGSGMGLQQDVLKVETHAIRLRHQHLVLEQEQRRLQAHINHLLSRSANAALVTSTHMLIMPALPTKAVLENWLMDYHPALKGLQAKSDAAMISQRLIGKDDYPDIQLNLGYNELWNASALRLQVGVSLNIPLDFGKRTARKNASQFEYHSVQMEIQDKRNQLLSKLEAELSNYDQASHGIQLIESELLPSAKQTVSATLANYEGGGGNFFELIDAQEQLLDTQLLLSQSMAEQYMSLAEINKLTGGQIWPRGIN